VVFENKEVMINKKHKKRTEEEQKQKRVEAE
jgi:hypothetical protein